jgi:hypothetical protein
LRDKESLAGDNWCGFLGIFAGGEASLQLVEIIQKSAIYLQLSLLGAPGVGILHFVQDDKNEVYSVNLRVQLHLNSVVKSGPLSTLTLPRHQFIHRIRFPVLMPVITHISK